MPTPQTYSSEFGAKILKEPLFSIPHSTIRIPHSSSRKVTLQVDRFLFVDMASFIPDHGDPRVSVKIVIMVFPAVIDEQILFLIDEL